MIKHGASQSIGAQMINATTGAAFTDPVTVYITGDAGTQAIGTVGSGLCTHEGNGYHTYRPSADETNFDLIAFTFVGSGAIPQTIQVATVTAAQQAAVTGVSASTGSVSVANLITASMRRINVLEAGEDPSPEDLADAFLRFQDLIESLAIQSLLIYTVTRTTFALSSSKGIPGTPYTVGSGGDLNIARPTAMALIDRLTFYDTTATTPLEYRLTPMTRQAYESLAMKTLTSPLPTHWFYEPTFTSSLGSLYLWMVTTSSTLNGVIYAPTPVTQFGATSDVIVLPPGYKRFLRDTLALELWPEFRESDPIDPLLVRSAEESKTLLKTINLPMVDLGFDPRLTGPRPYNIYSDTF